MTETEENLLRNLLAKYRETDRAGFCELLLDVFFVVQESDAFTIFRHLDNAGQLQAAVVMVRGADDAHDLIDICQTYFRRLPVVNVNPVLDEEEEADDGDPEDYFFDKDI